VQIGLLGPFEVRTDDGVFAEVPGARLRGLLIALTLEPGHAVPRASPETAIAEFVMRPPSAPGLTLACHAPDTTTDTALYLVAPGQGSAQH